MDFSLCAGKFSATRTIRRSVGLLCVSAVFLLSGCTRLSQYLYESHYDSDIKKATRAIEAARNDAERAAAYSDRGSAYGEKARYLRAFKLISSDEYVRLFELAIKDHGQAIALGPETAETYYRRGYTYYNRASLDPKDNPDSRAFFAPAKADFSKAIDKDPRHYMAFDMRGLIDQQAEDWDEAIADYTQEAALNPQGRSRLIDAYCGRGSSYMKGKQYDLAISDFEKSIAIGSSRDSCECEPFNPLLWIYLDKRQDYNKARELVKRAKKSGNWIAPEYLEKLKKAPTP